MAVKLGELLLKEKMITPDQLNEGLKYQMIYGIRLGSSLIELGYVEEEALADLLSRKMGVPCIGREELESIPKELLISFPRRLVELYHVVPLKLEGQRLSVAISDPTNFAAIEEIGFATGYVIQPNIALDVHIARVLARHYKISLGDALYQQVAAQRRKRENDATPAVPKTITMPAYSESGELLNVTVPVEFEGFSSMLGDDADDMYALSEEVKRYTVDRVSLDFSEARSRDDVAHIFIKYLGQEFGTAALFIVRGNGVVGWRAVSGSEKVDGFEELSLLLSKPSVMHDVVTSRTFSMGMLVNTPENRLIQKNLRISPETSVLVLPLAMLNKVVAVILVTADMDTLGHRLQELQKLVRKASLAFEMLIIKNKILMT
jgi:hypothetical protein